VIVTDSAGVVRYFKQGAMSEAEIDSTLALINQFINKDGAAKTAQR
jgi:predicted transcriptional regulator